MERREHKRIYVHQKANILVDEQTYGGYVENASEIGIGYLMSLPVSFRDDFLSNKSIELDLEIEQGKNIILQCVVVWTRRGLISGKTVGIGMTVINPPIEYSNWISTLLADSANGDSGAEE